MRLIHLESIQNHLESIQRLISQFFWKDPQAGPFQAFKNMSQKMEMFQT